MIDDEYYKAIAKAAEEWRRQYILSLQEIAKVAKTQLPIINTLQATEKAMVGFKNIQEQIPRLNVSIPHLENTVLENIQKANLQMSSVLVSLKPYQDLSKQILVDHSLWFESLKSSLSLEPQVKDIADAIGKNFAAMANSALLAQQSIARINFQAIGKIAKIADDIRVSFCQELKEMTNSYCALWDTFRVDSQKLFSVPLAVSKTPSIEIFLAVHQAEVSTKEVEALPEEKEFLSEVELGKTHMHELIASINKQLLLMYEGAVEAIGSDNVERVRHATASLRELLTHILQELAPDKEFFKWNQDESNIHNGRPTRKGRLLYICRNINYGQFTNFVDQDISAALAFLGLLHKGTHSIKNPYDENQIKALLIRMECLLDFIIRISRGN